MPHSSAKRRTTLASSVLSAELNPAAGSSSRSTLGCIATARAIASSRRFPYDRSLTSRWRSWSSWNSLIARTTSGGKRRVDRPDQIEEVRAEVLRVGGHAEVLEHRRVLEQFE